MTQQNGRRTAGGIIMNKLTAVFLDVLGAQTGQMKRAADLVKVNMQAEFAERTGELLSPGTLFFSDEGRELKQQLAALQSKIEHIERAQQAVGYVKQLKRLYIRAEKLHRDTQKQIRKKGYIDARRLHFFYRGEQSEAIEILENYIRTELYLTAAFGGGRVFLTRKPLKSFRHTLQDRIRYLKEELLPITDTQNFRQDVGSRYWAVQHQEAIKAGPMGVLPGFVITEPVKTGHRFVPGEHAALPSRKGIILQGMGYLTNLTPQSVENAQIKGALITRITPDQLLKYTDYLQDPDSVLGTVFAGKYYLINAAEYFGAASYAEASVAIQRRSRLGQCVFCGKPVEGEYFCGNCEKRIKIV